MPRNNHQLEIVQRFRGAKQPLVHQGSSSPGSSGMRCTGKGTVLMGGPCPRVAALLALRTARSSTTDHWNPAAK